MSTADEQDGAPTIGFSDSLFRGIFQRCQIPPKRLSDNSVTDFRLPERAIEVESAPKI